MKKYILAASLVFGGVQLQASTLQDFLTQSGTQERYDQLSEDQKKEFEIFWGKIDALCAQTKESFAQLMQGEALEILKSLFDKLQDPQVNLQFSLQIENGEEEVAPETKK